MKFPASRFNEIATLLNHPVRAKRRDRRRIVTNIRQDRVGVRTKFRRRRIEMAAPMRHLKS